MKISPGWSTARHILCIQLGGLSDLFSSMPAIRALKQSVLRRRIVVVTSQAAASAAPLLPEVEAFWKYDARWMNATESSADRNGDLELIGRLRAARFDGAVIFTRRDEDSLSEAVLILAEIPLRLAFTRRIRQPDADGFALRCQPRRRPG